MFEEPSFDDLGGALKDAVADGSIALDGSESDTEYEYREDADDTGEYICLINIVKFLRRAAELLRPVASTPTSGRRVARQ